MLPGFEHFRRLSMADKIRLVQEMWDEIAASDEPVNLPESVLEELQRRFEEAKRDPSVLITHEELWRRVDKDLAARRSQRNLEQERMQSPPDNPAGGFVAERDISDARHAELIAVIENAPRELTQTVAGLSEQQLDTKYRNWMIRQIVHHLADSHLHSYIRFKWALTEDQPTIKPYDEGKWSDLPDVRGGDIAAPLAMYAGVHQCWTQLLRAMTPEQFARSFHHPETGRNVVLSDALCYYAWHSRHHTAQITWLRGRRLA